MTYSDQTVPASGAGCGASLRQAREAAGMSIEQAAAQLRMTVRSVANLESEDWSSLGAPVFVRGQLRSYARLLAVDIEPYLEQVAEAAEPPATLVSYTHVPRYQQFAESIGRRAIYFAITAAIIVPVWLGTRPHLGNDSLAVQSLDVSSALVETNRVAAAPATSQRTPLVASIASLPAKPAALSIALSGESWVQVFDVDGRELEQGLLTAGERRNYGAGEVGHVILGNVDAVEVKRAGVAVDLQPFSRANVARFTLSSDGSLAPVAP